MKSVFFIVLKVVFIAACQTGSWRAHSSVPAAPSQYRGPRPPPWCPATPETCTSSRDVINREKETDTEPEARGPDSTAQTQVPSASWVCALPLPHAARGQLPLRWCAAQAEGRLCGNYSRGETPGLGGVCASSHRAPPAPGVCTQAQGQLGVGPGGAAAHLRELGAGRCCSRPRQPGPQFHSFLFHKSLSSACAEVGSP